MVTKKEDETHKSHPEPRNIVTRPPKKGSGYGIVILEIDKVGYPDVTIGKPHEYISDPYDRTESIARVSCYVTIDN